MMTYMEIDPEKDKTVWEELQDNRDFGVLSSWDPPDRWIARQYVMNSSQNPKLFKSNLLVLEVDVKYCCR